jgi:hypothetical protein
MRKKANHINRLKNYNRKNVIKCLNIKSVFIYFYNFISLLKNQSLTVKM